LERVGNAFPQLEIVELIGRGGMGFVFKARQPHLDRYVALKLLPDKLARDPRFAERFNREGRVLARLNHPNIVSVYDFGQTEHFYFLLMEYVDGVNLRQAMKAGRFSPAEALAIVPRICEALQYAHGEGILHRDIKPENILLDARGQVKIADFGIAKLVGDEKADVTLTATGAALGTPHYMAPEQLEKPAEVDHRADIYSLGVVFYEMLTGELPIGRFAAPSSKTPVGSAVDEVVFRTLEKDRERRFQSAGEMKTSVEDLTDEMPPRPAAPVDNALVARPAKALIATGIFNWLASAVVLGLLAIPEVGRAWPIAPGELGVICAVIMALTSLILIGGLKMLRLESYPLAIVGSVVAMVTSPGGLIGLPVGIWALLTLRQEKVRAAFKNNPSASAPPPKLPPAGGGVPAWSQKAIWAAVLIGLSLPVPLLLSGLLYLRAGGIGGMELLLLAGSLGLPGFTGTLLGWMALSDIRAHRGQLRGLPLAAFAALAWPLLVVVGATLMGPWLLRLPSGPRGVMPAGLLLLIIPIGTITFALWAVHAVVRWGSNAPPSRRRGVLKWVFFGMLLAGLGLVVAMNSARREPASATRQRAQAEMDSNWARAAAIANPPGNLSVTATGVPPLTYRWARDGGPPAAPATNAAPSIRFTFIAVELRELADGRWLAIDYLDDVHGDCQKAFPWETTIPGFKGHTRTSEFVNDDPGPSRVRHQRIEYRMPASAPREQLVALRENLEKAVKHKSVRLELGEKELPLLLFDLSGAEGGSFKAWLKVVPLPATQAKDSPANEAAEIRIRMAQEKLDIVRKQQAANVVALEQVVEAEHQLAVAEARGDAVAVAQANLLYADYIASLARKRFEAGVIAAPELREAENQRALREAELKAVQPATRAKASPQ